VIEGWVVALIVSASVTVIGWMVARLTTQNEVIRTQRETIDVLKRQNDRLETAADVTERVLSSLPVQRQPGGKR
jgi:uncharacterized membrane-anchored protein YhcB (DUF1043 family)